MRDLITKVERIMPASEPDFDKKRLALILGGTLAKRRVKDWMVATPASVDNDSVAYDTSLPSMSDNISLEVPPPTPARKLQKNRPEPWFWPAFFSGLQASARNSFWHIVDLRQLRPPGWCPIDLLRGNAQKCKPGPILAKT